MKKRSGKPGMATLSASGGRRLAGVLALTFLTGGVASCRTGFSDKQFLNYDPGVDPGVRRVERRFVGEDFMIGSPGFFITEGRSFSIPTLLREVRLLENCSELKNIDIEFYSQYYIFVGMPRALVRADCIK